jgi:lipoyl-dependent peroxiredoxin subunit D
MEAIDRLRERIPTPAKDIQLNLSSVLQGGALDDRQRWGVAIACALSTQSRALADAVLADAASRVGDDVLDDARAAAALMAMNNVYYRFRHLVGKAEYEKKPARLRMNRIANPRTDRVTFELMCLAVSAINGCESCIKSHEHAVIEGGLTSDHVNDAVRIAATLRAVEVALTHA